MCNLAREYFDYICKSWTMNVMCGFNIERVYYNREKKAHFFLVLFYIYMCFSAIFIRLRCIYLDSNRDSIYVLVVYNSITENRASTWIWWILLFFLFQWWIVSFRFFLCTEYILVQHETFKLPFSSLLVFVVSQWSKIKNRLIFNSCEIIKLKQKWQNL